MTLTQVADIESGDELTVKFRGQSLQVVVKETRNDHRAVVLTVESKRGEMFDVSYPYDTMLHVQLGNIA